jgi:hypothetical protein
MDKDLENKFEELLREAKKNHDYLQSILLAVIFLAILLTAVIDGTSGKVNERLDRIEQTLDVDAAVSLGSSLKVCDTLLTE